MQYEIAIIGGGPAGTSTAMHLLARRPDLAGQIAIFEKKSHPREKYCAGAISSWGIDVLERLALGNVVDGVPIKAVAVRSGKRITRVGREGLGVVVRRSQFDARLFREAARRGAVTHETTPVTALARDESNSGWTLETGAGTVRARVLVGADGASGSTRRQIGLSEPRRRAHLYLAETPGREARDDVGDGTMLFDLGPASYDGIQGYYWDFSAPLDGVPGTSRGIYHMNDHPLPQADTLKTAFARYLDVRGVKLADVRLKAHAIRPFQVGSVASVHGALLAGESVGVDPVTGEGIAHALAYGELAAGAITDALASGDLSFADWSARIAGSLVGRHLRDACRLAPLTYGRRGRLFAEFLASSEGAMQLGVRWYQGEKIPRATRMAMMVRFAGFAARHWFG